MLQIKSFTFNPFRENTYLLIDTDSKKALVIDPGMCHQQEEDLFFNFLNQENLEPLKIINTHAHVDHILGIDPLKQKYKIPFGLHHKELPILKAAKATSLMFGMDLNKTPEVDFNIQEKESIKFGSLSVEILLTPGHSPGSISFYIAEEGIIFSGDVLFKNGVGRTDLPGGNQQQLFHSIQQQLFSLPEETVVYPGHGPKTTLKAEKETLNL